MKNRNEIVEKLDVVRCVRFFSKKLNRYVYAREVGLPWFTFVFERTPANGVE